MTQEINNFCSWIFVYINSSSSSSILPFFICKIRSHLLLGTRPILFLLLFHYLCGYHLALYVYLAAFPSSLPVWQVKDGTQIYLTTSSIIFVFSKDQLTWDHKSATWACFKYMHNCVCSQIINVCICVVWLMKYLEHVFIYSWIFF